MPRFAHVLVAFTLLTTAAFAQADPNAPPAAAGTGLGIASIASGMDVPVGARGGVQAGSVPEPETWIFTLAGLVFAGLLRRRKR